MNHTKRYTFRFLLFLSLLALFLFSIPSHDGKANSHILNSEEKFVVIRNPDDPRWDGRMDYVEKELRILINAAQVLGLLKNTFYLPIPVEVASLGSIYASARIPSLIRINETSILEFNDRDLHAILAHELAHLLRYWEDKTDIGHSPRWREMCQSLIEHTVENAHTDAALWFC